MKTIFLFCFFFIAQSLVFGMNWTSIQSKVKYIYQSTNNSDDLEVLKIYYDNKFEHLIYQTHEEKIFVSRNLGSYTFKEDVIVLNPDSLNFESVIYNKPLFYNGDLYETKFQSKYQQSKSILNKVSKLKYNFPFFIYPITKELINNPELENKLNLDEYISFLTRFEKDEENKLLVVLDYIKQNNKILSSTSNSIYQITEEELRKIILSKNKEIHSWQFAQLLKRFFNNSNFKMTCVEGYVKSCKHFNALRLHQWLMIEKNNFKYLSDPAAGNQWLNVSPEIMIKTHFPINSDFQLIEEPVSKESFETLPIVELKNERVKYISMYPEQKQIEVGNQLNLMFDSESFNVKIYSWDGSDENSIVPFKDFSRVSSRGKTMLTLPINEYNFKFILEINNDYSLYLETIQDSKFDSNGSNYWVKNGTQSNYSTKNVSKTKSQLLIEDLMTMNLNSQIISSNPLIQFASKYYGLADIEGKINNKQILIFFRETGHQNIKDDETSWCSVFVSYCVKELKGNYPKSATARSWLDKGVKVNQPNPGDLVIFWRDSPNSWKGHVGIFLGFDKETKTVITLGGNQDDQVKIKKYPVNQVLGYRRVL